MHEALDDPKVFKVVAKKSAQVAWTDGVVLNYIGKTIDIDPTPVIVMFAKEKAAKEFNEEKLTPMAEVTPAVAEKLQLDRRKSSDNRWDFKSFPNGFLKLVGSNSPSSVKSTPAPRVIVEEPDDCNDNVKDQGDTITLLEERTKTYKRRKVVFGGTPTIKGVSRIDAAYDASDKRKFLVPCHGCGESHVLMWENVRALDDPTFSHEVFGHTRPETSRYICPHCGEAWTDAEKNRNVRKGKWVATAHFYGIAGFYINELYSPFPGSTLQILMEKYLTAQALLATGDDTKMRAFVNSSEGLSYEYKSDLAKAETLSERAEDYEEKTVPWGGMVLSAGVDVQHDRLAVVVRAWGRGSESWLVYWGEIHGQTLVPDAGAWQDLDLLLDGGFPHVSGHVLPIRAASIDSSDGALTDTVYAYVRRRQARGYMAIKGASEQSGAVREIFSKPKESIDLNKKQKAHPSGVRPYIVGTNRAKDLIVEGRFQLAGSGPGRYHWYKSVRPDYWEQITSEIKVPHKTVKNRKVWAKKSGVRNEALDCEVYALHASMSLKVHLLKPAHWDAMEEQLRQKQIFAAEATPATTQPDDSGGGEKVQTSAQNPTAQPAPPPVVPQKRGRSRSRIGGYSASKW